MIKVSELKRLGIAVVAGDKFLHGSDEREITESQSVAISEGSEFDNVLITEFAWRENTVKMPDFDGDVEAEMTDGTIFTAKSVDLRWLKDGRDTDIISWKPCMKSLLAQVESDKPAPVNDPVHKPKHYEVIDGVESIELIAAGLTLDEWRGFCLGNIMKYRFRAGKKDKLEQDIAKANEYEMLFNKHKGKCRK